MFDPTQFKNALVFVNKAKATQDNRPILTGINFDLSKVGRCTLVGADGYHLHYWTIAYTGLEAKSFVLGNTQELAEKIRKTGAVVGMEVNETTVTFTQSYKGKVTTVICPMLAGKFPSWTHIVPSAQRIDYCIKLSRDTIEHLVGAFSCMGGAKISMTPTGMIAESVHLTNPKYKTTMHLPDDMPAGYEVGLNWQYVLDTLLDSDHEVYFYVDQKDHHNPVAIYRVSGAKALIMPLKIDNYVA